MTTEPTNVGAERSHDTPEEGANAGDATRDTTRKAVENIERQLREGKLRRLEIDPPAVVAAILAGACSAVRFHNEIAAARLGFDAASWRLDPQDRIELRAPSGRSVVKLDRWSYLFHDRATDRLLARDHLGDNRVEFDLARWPDELEPTHRADLTHRAQSQLESTVPHLAEIELHQTTFDESTFERAWRRCNSYAETRHLERAARSNRRDLLRNLPAQLARTLDPRRVTEVFSALSRADGPVLVDLVGPGHRTTLDPRELECRAGANVLLGVGGDAHLAVDRRRVESAHIVEVPGGERKQKALELLDESGELAGRLRRPADADPTTTFAWRASLTGGVRG